jgi:hypothetical protein
MGVTRLLPFTEHARESAFALECRTRCEGLTIGKLSFLCMFAEYQAGPVSQERLLGGSGQVLAGLSHRHRLL